MASDGRTRPAGHSPFPGLRSFQDSPWRAFCGREAEAHALSRLWRSKRVTILHGEAGAGKTSLVRAGVVHLLRGHHADVLPVGDLTERSAFAAAPLLEHNPLTLALAACWAPLEAPARLSGMTLADVLRQRAPSRPGSVTYAAVDHAEELFSAPAQPRRYREEFIGQIAAALRERAGLHLLVIIRDSRLGAFLADSRDHEQLRPGAWFRLPGLSPAAAAEAVRRPAQLAGAPAAPGTAEMIVDAVLASPADYSAGRLDDPEAVRVYPPYLQCVTSRWWAARRGHGQQPPDDRPAGEGQVTDADSWLSDLIVRAVYAVSRYYELDPARLCRWLARVAGGAAGGRVTVTDRLGLVASVQVMVLRAFEDHYVLRAGQRAGRPWTQLQSQRMSGPLRLAGHRITGLAAAARPATFADRLADAVRAFARGDYDLADRHAWRALRVSAEAGRGAEARAQTLLGNIAYQRGHPQRARDHYVTAAKLFEATTSRRAVGHLLAAIGRLHLTEDDTAAAAVSLQSAVSRLPFDGSVKVDLARAFAASGAQRAAVAVLEGVLADNEPEAGRALSLRSAILADLGEAR